MRITAANSLPVPYIGYVCVDIEVCGVTLKDIGLLVVKDSVSDSLSIRKSKLSGVVGCNILKNLYNRLKSEF